MRICLDTPSPLPTHLLLGSRTDLLISTHTVALTLILLSTLVIPNRLGRTVTRLQEWQQASHSWPWSHFCVPTPLLVPLRDFCVHLIR